MSLSPRRRTYFLLKTLSFMFIVCSLVFVGSQKTAFAESVPRPLAIFPRYPGSNLDSEISRELLMVLQSLTSSKYSTEGEIVALRTSDSLDKVVRFYRTNPPADNWKKIMELGKEGASFIELWEKDGESAQIFAAEDEGETVILLGYGPKAGAREDEDGYTFYTEEDGLMEDTSTVIAEGADGSIWFGTSDGLVRFVAGEWKNYDFGPLGRGVKDIAVAEDGDLWVGTWSDGLMYFDGEIWSKVTEREGLKNDRVSSIAIDSSGKVWVGSLNRRGGLSVYDGVRWTNYSDQDGLPSNYVHSVSISRDDRVWVGTKEGVAAFDGNGWERFSVKDGLLDDEVEEVAADSAGNLWAVSDRGISRYDGGKWRTYPYQSGIFGNKVFRVEIAPDGRVWFATKAGIACFTGDTWHILSMEDGLPDSYVLSVLVTTDGELWFGTLSDGIGLGSLPEFE